MKKAIKVITIAVALATATTSYGFEEEWEEYLTIILHLKKAFPEALHIKPEDSETPEKARILKNVYCAGNVAALLATVRMIQTKRGATEAQIKEEGRRAFIAMHITNVLPGQAKLAASRGKYAEYLEFERNKKICFLNGYENVTGERI